MEFFKQQTNIDFLGLRRWAGIFSVVICLGSIAIMAIKGLNWGLDFTGGYSVQVSYVKAPDLTKVRNALDAANFREARVTTYGSTRDLQIRFAPQEGQSTGLSETQQGALKDKLKTTLTLGQPVEINSLNYIGSEVGSEMVQQGILAIIVSVLAIMVYVALRFDYRFAISAAVALAHDPLLILGIFSLFHIEFTLISLAALLAVIGFSLNDTVVIYDRIRENFRKMRKATPVEVVNRSINDTLSRTLMTSGLTLLVVVILYVFGGPALQPFALVLIIGILIGTYSSIYIAGALSIKLGINRLSMMPAKKEEDSRP
ncbi:protein translocase subunit SecF [Piscirickettsia salmonis]|uniref:protein translocase subunit SecF n=1 Tax=Piscirickettsia salmonis TaxID=1238 RepID=UPI0007C8CB72|nr:preprotein translocase subunit SecF [Piscirickettsiaceae bacterium NZ-RLO1]